MYNMNNIYTDEATLLHRYSNFAVEELLHRDPDISHHAKRVVLDWFAATFPGTQCPPATLLARALHDEMGVGRSSVLGTGTTAFPATAAWINGSASHSVEYDDIYREAVYHPGSPIIAAALAVGESHRASGKAFLAAIVAGYEISTRVGAALQPSHVRYFHTTGTVGCLGAAATAACLLSGDDPVAVRHAMAIATTFASGLQQAVRSETMTKPLHAGHAASVGVSAAQAAAYGVTGSANIVEGPVGLGEAMADQPAWELAIQGLGSDYHIRHITHKIHACTGHMFPAIDAVLVLRAQHHIEPDYVQTIRIETYTEAINVAGRFELRSPYEGKFSLPYVVSHALVYGSVHLDAFEQERVQSPVLRSLMSRCTLHADAEMSAGFPSKRSARVTVTMTDGQQFTHFVAPYRRGDPEAPLSDAELEAKFEELCTPVIGRQQAMALRDKVWRLDEIDVSNLLRSP